MKRVLFIPLVLMFIANLSFAQINIKVGYNGGYANLDKTNNLFDQFNAQNPSATESFENIHYLHGLELGARYSFFENLAFEMGFSSINNSNKSTGLTSSTGNQINEEWKISLSNYYVGLDMRLYKAFGIGANIGYQQLKYKAALDGASKKDDISSENQLNTRLYLVFEFESDNVSFSMRPYVSFGLDQYDISEFNGTLIGTKPIIKEDIMVYGVSFMFYNGPQR